MPELFGGEWSEGELRAWCGSPEQFAGVDRLRYTEGPEAGVELLRFRTGSGLEFDLLPSRGMDICGAWYQGIPLAWLSAQGTPHPAYFEPAGLGWLRGFFGGLLTTCGLLNVGSPGRDPDTGTLYAGIGTEDSEVVKLGLHGRVNHTPARRVSADAAWAGERYLLAASGVMREAIVFGENVELRRTISTSAGSRTIRLQDRVTNQGWNAVPHMLLYHLNLGWPVVSPASELITNGGPTIARDDVAAPGLPDCRRFAEPQPSYPEQVFYHAQIPDGEGWAQVGIINRELRGGFGVGVRYRFAPLPQLVQWKSLKRGTYVCGLEPANCRVTGRADERAAGRLRILEAGESIDYELELMVLDGAAACAAFESAAAR